MPQGFVCFKANVLEIVINHHLSMGNVVQGSTYFPSARQDIKTLSQDARRGSQSRRKTEQVEVLCLPVIGSIFEDRTVYHSRSALGTVAVLETVMECSPVYKMSHRIHPLLPTALGRKQTENYHHAPINRQRAAAPGGEKQV